MVSLDLAILYSGMLLGEGKTGDNLSASLLWQGVDSLPRLHLPA